MMKGRIALFAVVLASASIPAVRAQGIDVGGEAGRYVTITFNGCYQIRNNHYDRRVKVQMGPYSFNLQVGESKTLTIGSTCVTAYVGDTYASFIDPPS